jgi:primosomal protein N' (replication factor Y)
MSAGERADAWRWLRQGKFKIALGPRSAVFAPLENLGVVVVDEEHESSYKQNDPAPRYHARDVAVMRARMAGCPVILGSATPSLESYHNALSEKYRLLRLTQRIDETPMPVVTVVPRPGFYDKSPIFSTLLLERIAERLGSKDQIILLQNRRGYATLLRCGSCGFIEGCPHCDITLTYHQKGRSLRCHYCGYERAASDSCSKCGGATMKYKGVGTQQVEEALRRHHPDARIIRMDLDTTRHKGSHDRIVTEFEQGKGDILFGTQMVAKGHDFPGVRLVGVVSADTELNFPDFRAGERAFQLLTQAAGRAGRRSLIGEVVIQSGDPSNPLFQFVIDQDYERFYEWASSERSALNYPPFGRLIAVRFRGADSKETAAAAEAFRKRFHPQPGVEILGPAPSPIERLRGLYRYQMLFRAVKSRDPSGERLRGIVRRMLDESPRRMGRVRISVDVDPLDMM